MKLVHQLPHDLKKSGASLNLNALCVLSENLKTSFLLVSILK